VPLSAAVMQVKPATQRTNGGLHAGHPAHLASIRRIQCSSKHHGAVLFCHRLALLQHSALWLALTAGVQTSEDAAPVCRNAQEHGQLQTTTIARLMIPDMVLAAGAPW